MVRLLYWCEVCDEHTDHITLQHPVDVTDTQLLEKVRHALAEDHGHGNVGTNADCYSCRRRATIVMKVVEGA